MKQANSSILKITTLVVTLVTLGVGLVVAFTNVDNRTERNTDDIAVLIPQVNKNTEHRLQDDVDTRYVKEKLANIDLKMTEILEEIRNK